MNCLFIKNNYKWDIKICKTFLNQIFNLNGLKIYGKVIVNMLIYYKLLNKKDMAKYRI